MKKYEHYERVFCQVLFSMPTSAANEDLSSSVLGFLDVCSDFVECRTATVLTELS